MKLPNRTLHPVLETLVETDRMCCCSSYPSKILDRPGTSLQMGSVGGA